MIVAQVPFEDCLEPVKYSKKIHRKDFLSQGMYPIVSQEIELINGYWNNSQDVFYVSRPLVIFGDHTQTLKYIDFDFVLGADGVKILLPRPYIEAKYLYYFLMSTKMHSLGYARHYRLLKELFVPIPPLHEQQRIVALLDQEFAAIDAAKTNTEINLKNARIVFSQYLQKFDAVRKPLGELVNITTGKLDANAATKDGKYPFFTCSREVFKIDVYAFDCEAILLAGNNAVGDFNVKHYRGKFNAYQRTYVLTVKDERRLLYRYLFYQIENSLLALKAQAVGANTKFLKLGMIKGLEIPLPSIADQTVIVKKLDDLLVTTNKLEQIYSRKLFDLNELKRSLLNKAFYSEL